MPPRWWVVIRVLTGKLTYHGALCARYARAVHAVCRNPPLSSLYAIHVLLVSPSLFVVSAQDCCATILRNVSM